MHVLKYGWCLWIHLVNEPDWSIASYIRVLECHSIEELIALHETVILSESVIRKCMLFYMKESIQPSWEHETNMNGGCFTFKISGTNIKETWANILYMVAGNTISNNPDFIKDINGVVLSPKKHYYVVQLWMKTKIYTDSDISPQIHMIAKDGIIFKKFNV